MLDKSLTTLVSKSAACLMMGILLTACQPKTSDNTSKESSESSGLRLSSILGEPEQSDFARATLVRDFVFPVDHGPHNQYRSEWWYLTAVLKDDTGNEYGVHYTLFRQALTPKPTGAGPWHTGQAFLGHLAVTDVASGKHYEAERFARGHPDQAGVFIVKNETKKDDVYLEATIEDWRLAGDVSDTLDLKLNANEPSTTDPFGVELSLSQTAPIVLQGNRGLSEKGPGSASYYYSMPRIEISGTLLLGDKRVPVNGLGWLDREWSTSVLGDHLSGWDWFSLQLDDQRSIMAFRLRRHDGTRDAYDHGLLVNHQELGNKAVVGVGDTGVTLLKADDFSLMPTRFYSDKRGIKWPVSWTLSTQAETFKINALLDQQTVDLSILYWEGMVEVLDASDQRLGLGYMELTGYTSDANSK